MRVDGRNINDLKTACFIMVLNWADHDGRNSTVITELILVFQLKYALSICAAFQKT